MSVLDNILEKILEKRNIFLTGPGGCGKSYNILKIKEMFPDIVLTSTTGVSAVNIGGVTIHSFSGLGVLKYSDKLEDVLKKVKKSRHYQHLKSCKFLVIDEISMLGSQFLDTMNNVFKKIKNNTDPMGGIQIIFTGDFLQLPPIGDELCFKSQTWKELNLHTVYLKEMYRFTDQTYADMLNRIRVGDHTSDDNKEIYKRFFAYKKLEGIDNLIIKPSFLFGKKINVDEKNMEELSKLTGKMETLHAIDYTHDKYDLELMENIVPSILLLKEGAQVMVNVNISIEECIINGTRGIVKGIHGDVIDIELLNGNEIEIRRHEFIYEKPNTNIKLKREQFPLILAYALSIHKIQGASLDSAVIDLGRTSIFEPSQGYVALSRVRSFEGLYVINFNPKSLFVNQEIVEFYKNISK